MPIVTLWAPEIPGNTGAIGRLCAANSVPLWILGKPSFEISDRSAQRAGLDYWEHLRWEQKEDPEAFLNEFSDRCVFFTKRATRTLFDHQFLSTDILVFGPESTGLPSDVIRKYPERCVRIPQSNNNVRSLNLAQSAAVGLYEALRQMEKMGGTIDTPYWA